MLSLERELLVLRDRGEIAEEKARPLIAVERREVFSLYYELRILLYLAVTLIVTGAGLYLRENVHRIGPLVLISGTAAVAAACYAFVILRRHRASLLHDYLLLLGALLVSADLAYAETQYHILDDRWSWHLIVLALFHGATAYFFRSRVLLSVSITSLAAFLGIQRTADFGLYAGPDLAMRMLACAGVLLVWRQIHERRAGTAAFLEVFNHAIALLSLAATLLLTFDAQTRLIGLPLAFAAAGLSIRFGWRRREYAFVVYGTIVALIAGGHFFTEVIGFPTLVLLYFQASTLGAIIFLFWSWRRLREGER
jgi:hypothetical protein